MTDVAYVTLDVFTAERFGGNPLAVIPDARGLDDALMQRIAREFNYSETTFVLPPDDPANTARVRIFTPADELPFAGHPNVGTGFVLAAQGELFGRALGERLRFEEIAGLVEVEVLRDTAAVTGARIRAPAEFRTLGEVPPETVAACASLAPGDIRTDSHAPIIASVGVAAVMAEVVSPDALAKARPDTAGFRTADARHESESAGFMLYLYARDPAEPDRVRARMFAPLHDIPEDPATGSAAATLGGLLAELDGAAEVTTTIAIAQGVEMGRPSEIEVRVRKAGGRVRDVFVAGPCVPVMRGTMAV
jgi:trans-2,3-dihydro-3-hydroxyanthranilate isomerase